MVLCWAKIAEWAKVVFGIKFGSVGFSSFGECGSFNPLKVVKDMRVFLGKLFWGCCNCWFVLCVVFLCRRRDSGMLCVRGRCGDVVRGFGIGVGEGVWVV